jgi:hypothetical protein
LRHDADAKEQRNEDEKSDQKDDQVSTDQIVDVAVHMCTLYQITRFNMRFADAFATALCRAGRSADIA